jgi:hypothetical protein
MMVVDIMWYNNMLPSDENDNDSSSEEEKEYRNESGSIKRKWNGSLWTKDTPRDNHRVGSSKKKAATSVTPSQKQIQPGNGTANKGGRVPGLHVSSSALISSMSQMGMPMPTVEHYSESSAVREFVRGDIYPRKKTFFAMKS